MRENRVRSMWRGGEAVVNGWLKISDPFSAEVMAHAGWDSLTIDMQHGPIDYQAALPMLQAVSTTETTPLVRVPWNEPGIVMKMLDLGCYGVICPMVNTRADAEAFVGACRYPSREYPGGYRSYGPDRALLYAGPDYARRANETVIAMAMIETGEALENLDEILSVPGLDAVYVGPADLSQSLGYEPHMDVSEPHLVAAVDGILAATRRHGVAAGIATGTPEYAARMVEKGFRLVTVLSDARLMSLKAAEVIAATKGGA